MTRAALAIAVREVDVERRVLTILGTTPTRDRFGDIIEPRGGDLKAFRKNPVFLWVHDYERPPIGKSIKERVTDEGIEFAIQFATTPFADEIFGLYRDGFLNAASIGFIPLEYEPLDPDNPWQGKRFKKWELLELSAVPVPANPDALALAIQKGVSQEVIRAVFIVEKGVISYGQAHPNGTPKAPEDEPWDGPAEVAAAEVEDLKVMCTWYDSEKPDVKASYKLPHHKAAGEHAVVWNGVRAAMARLMQENTQIPDDDRKGCYNHLARHYREFDKEPPEWKSLDEIVQAYVTPPPKAGPPDAVNKVGAVLAKRNKERLEKARDLIEEVLADAEGSQDDTDDAGKAAGQAASNMPTQPATKQDANPAELGILDPAARQAIAVYAAEAVKAELNRLLGRVC